MRRIFAIKVAAALLLTATSGCGTLLNLDGKERFDFSSLNPHPANYVLKYQRPMFPFGGVANDIAWIKDATQPIDSIFSVADLPFSLAGDILTLPWTSYAFLRGEQRPVEPPLRRPFADGDTQLPPILPKNE
jgi:uncharacterized protein YceK